MKCIKSGMKQKTHFFSSPKNKTRLLREKDNEKSPAQQGSTLKRKKNHFNIIHRTYPVPSDCEIPRTIPRAAQQQGRAAKQRDRAAKRPCPATQLVSEWVKWVDDGSEWNGWNGLTMAQPELHYPRHRVFLFFLSKKREQAIIYPNKQTKQRTEDKDKHALTLNKDALTTLTHSSPHKLKM